MMSPIGFDPLLAPWLIGLLVGLAVLGAALTGRAKLRSFIPRALAALIVGAALMNPQSITEERENLPDVALIITDKSASMSIGERAKSASALSENLKKDITGLGNTEVISVNIDPSEDGTRLTTALLEGLANMPADRIAGVFVITDGQVHDLPDAPQNLLPSGVPFHGIIVGDQNVRDRRMEAINAPRFGLVDETVDFEIKVEDPGFEAEQALIQVRLNGEEQATFNVNIGEAVTIPVKVERRGSNTVELIAQGMDGELTYLNNIFVQDVSGIRDRLRVLLITGEPHSGGRAWRNLLKSDPAVDLVQFSILRPPGKSVGARGSELSLISFPTRELFEEKVEEFDLIIFDQYRRRNILSPYYFQNIARYVDNGGALLVAAGTPYASPQSLYRSPLSTVLPARPTGEVTEGAFRAQLTDKGARHPITAEFAGERAARWGRWQRAIDATIISGDVIMQTEDEAPLLVIDKIGKGRTAVLLSDQAWLWAKGADGGGPYNEMFRRLAHWLMGEPDLEAEQLEAVIKDGQITITRRSLDDVPQTVRVVAPDGMTRSAQLPRIKPGVYSGTISADQQGAYRVQSGDIQTVAAAGALNPVEFERLTPTGDVIAPFIKATGGLLSFAGEDGSASPTLRSVKAGAKTSGADWAGVVAHERYDVTASKRVPLAPVLLFFALAAALLAWAWRAEGR